MFTLILLVLVTGTATFAWLKINQNAWFDDMEMQVNAQVGLKLSVDGSNYKNNLSNRDIKTAIIAKATGRTLKDVDGKVYYYTESTGQLESTDDYENDYKRVNLKPVTTNDGEHFKDVYGNIKLISQNAYVGLDIFIKSDNASPQNVYLSNQDMVYEDQIIPKTECITVGEEKIGFPQNLSGSFDTYNKETGEVVKYIVSSGVPIEGFKTLASDALRFSIKTTNNGVSDNKYRIYELNEGNGSYASDLTEEYYVGASGAAYDKNKNAALTYYNNVIGYESDILDQGMLLDDEEIPKYEDLPFTYKGLDSFDASYIGTLDAENGYGSSGSFKVTMNVWIEGWDADCIDTIFEQVVKLKMSFTGYRLQEVPVIITYRTTNPETGQTMDEKVFQQFQNLKISYDAPAKDVYTGNKHRFKGWGKLDEATGAVTPWNFDDYLVPDNVEVNENNEQISPRWVFVSMWE